MQRNSLYISVKSIALSKTFTDKLHVKNILIHRAYVFHIIHFSKKFKINILHALKQI